VRAASVGGLLGFSLIWIKFGPRAGCITVVGLGQGDVQTRLDHGDVVRVDLFVAGALVWGVFAG